MRKKKLVIPFIAILLVGVIGTMEFSGILLDTPWESVDEREVEEEFEEKSESKKKEVEFDFGDDALHSEYQSQQLLIARFPDPKENTVHLLSRHSLGLFLLYCCLKISFC